MLPRVRKYDGEVPPGFSVVLPDWVSAALRGGEALRAGEAWRGAASGLSDWRPSSRYASSSWRRRVSLSAPSRLT